MPLHESNSLLIENYLSIYKNVDSSMFDCYNSLKIASHILACEVSKGLHYTSRSIRTLMRTDNTHVLSADILLVPKIRSGLVMIDPFIELFHTSRVSHLLIKRSENNRGQDDKIVYGSPTPTVDEQGNSNTQAIVLDPLVSTGGSINLIIDYLMQRKFYESNIIIASLMCSETGAMKILAAYPNVQLFVGSITNVLDSAVGVYPKIGDLGDRIFGSKEI